MEFLLGIQCSNAYVKSLPIFIKTRSKETMILHTCRVQARLRAVLFRSSKYTVYDPQRTLHNGLMPFVWRSLKHGRG